MSDYNKLKVTELKELLKERGIPSTGLSKKAQIIEALETSDVNNGPGDQVEEGGIEAMEGIADDAANGSLLNAAETGR